MGTWTTPPGFCQGERFKNLTYQGDNRVHAKSLAGRM